MRIRLFNKAPTILVCDVGGKEKKHYSLIKILIAQQIPEQVHRQFYRLKSHDSATRAPATPAAELWLLFHLGFKKIYNSVIL